MPNRGERGVALLVALLFVVILTVIVVEYTYEMQVEASFEQNTNAELQAYIAAKSAIASGLSLLAADLDATTEMGNLGSLPTSVRGQVALPGGAARDSLDEIWAMGVAYQQINDAVMQCLVDDEFGKINLNALLQPRRTDGAPQPGQQQQPASGKPVPANQKPAGQKELQNVQIGGAPIRARNSWGDSGPQQQQAVVAEFEPNEVLVKAINALFRKRGLETDICDAILDWIDTDDDPSSSGAESDTYTSLEIPYSCKNGPMDSIDELLLIAGVTPEVFFGDPSQGQVPLSELLTVRGDARGMVNINTARYEVLEAIGEALGQTGLADQVISAREQTPFENAQDLQSRGIVPAPDPKNPQAQLFTVAGKVFRLRGQGVSGESKVRIEAYVLRDGGVAPAQQATPANSQEMNLHQQQAPNVGTGMFRILDWRVTR